jgi:phosphinothricin acetyltransferase
MQPEDGVAVLKIFEEGIAGNATSTKKFLLGNIGTKIILRFVDLLQKTNNVMWACALKPVSNRECFSGVAEVNLYY